LRIGHGHIRVYKKGNLIENFTYKEDITTYRKKRIADHPTPELLTTLDQSRLAPVDFVSNNPELFNSSTETIGRTRAPTSHTLHPVFAKKKKKKKNL
jgi:hypothetical protein